VAVGPLKPELCAYAFAVDGVPALDGRVARFRRDGSRLENILIIPGPDDGRGDRPVAQRL
jgi:hypothetical protein